jgi:CRP-like cAMP-binding protein
VPERHDSAPASRQESIVSKSPPSPNRLLASLLPADFELLRPHLKPVELKNETVLFAAGDPNDRVYFPHGGILSLVVELSGGQAIEAAMVGRDSMLGATAALDGQVSLNKAIIQLPGHGESLEVTRFREVAEQSPVLRTTLLRTSRSCSPALTKTIASDVGAFLATSMGWH